MSTLLWIINYDRSVIKRINREVEPELWAKCAKQLLDNEISYAIERGEFLVSHNLLADWQAGQPV